MNIKLNFLIVFLLMVSAILEAQNQQGKLRGTLTKEGQTVNSLDISYTGPNCSQYEICASPSYRICWKRKGSIAGACRANKVDTNQLTYTIPNLYSGVTYKVKVKAMTKRKNRRRGCRFRKLAENYFSVISQPAPPVTGRIEFTDLGIQPNNLPTNYGDHGVLARVQTDQDNATLNYYSTNGYYTNILLCFRKYNFRYSQGSSANSIERQCHKARSTSRTPPVFNVGFLEGDLKQTSDFTYNYLHTCESYEFIAMAINLDGNGSIINYKVIDERIFHPDRSGVSCKKSVESTTLIEHMISNAAINEDEIAYDYIANLGAFSPLPPNLVNDYKFDNSTTMTGWLVNRTTPGVWFQENASIVNGIDQNTNISPFHGEGMVRIKKTTGGSVSQVAQAIGPLVDVAAANGPTTAKWSTYVNSESATTVNIVLATGTGLSTNGLVNRNANVVPFTTDNDPSTWEFVSGSAQIPSGTNYLELEIFSANNQIPDTGVFFEYPVVMTNAPEKIISNSSFESGSVLGWNTTSWQNDVFYGENASFVGATNLITPFSGLKMLKISETDTGLVSRVKHLMYPGGMLSPNGESEITVSAHINAVESKSINFSIRDGFNVNSNGELIDENGNILNSEEELSDPNLWTFYNRSTDDNRSTWEKVSFTYTPSPSSNYLELRFNTENNDIQNDGIFLDNVDVYLSRKNLLWDFSNYRPQILSDALVLADSGYDLRFEDEYMLQLFIELYPDAFVLWQKDLESQNNGLDFKNWLQQNHPLVYDEIIEDFSILESFGFEPGGLPITAWGVFDIGRWSAENSLLVTGNNEGITPDSGEGMIRVNRTAGGVSQVTQFIDLSEYAELIDTGEFMADFSIRSNVPVAVDFATKPLWTLYLRSGVSPNLHGSPAPPDTNGTTSVRFALDSNPATWETVSGHHYLPAGTRYLQYQFYTNPNNAPISNGVYFDNAAVSIREVEDADGDKLDNLLEEMGCTNALLADTDADGILDGDEDINKSGRVDNGETDPCNPDTDADGMYDGYEVVHNLDPINGNDANIDIDGDGLTNLEEFTLDTNPRNMDTDEDGLNDSEDPNPLIPEQSVPVMPIWGVLALYVLMSISAFKMNKKCRITASS